MSKILSRKQRRKRARQERITFVMWSASPPELHPGGNLETLKGKLHLRLADTVTAEPDGFTTVQSWVRPGKFNPEFCPRV